MPINVFFDHTTALKKQSHERYFYIINQMGFDLNTNVCLLLWGFSDWFYSLALPGSLILGHMTRKRPVSLNGPCKRDLGLFIVPTLQKGIWCKTTSLILFDVLEHSCSSKHVCSVGAGAQSLTCFAVLMREEIYVLNEAEGRRTWRDGFIRDEHASSDGE